MGMIKKNKCAKCGGSAELTGAGYCDDWIEGPFYVRCVNCGKESESYQVVKNAVRDWNMKNERAEAT